MLSGKKETNNFLDVKKLKKVSNNKNLIEIRKKVEIREQISQCE